MQYLPIVLTVALIHLLAVMSPGPDLIMVTRNSLFYSRRAGVYSAVGLALGILVHVAYSLVGIGLLISRSIILFSIIKYIGAAYLTWIGIRSLLAKRHAAKPDAAPEQAERKEISSSEALRIGFLTNVTNPKATLFFLSLFTIIITPETPMPVKVFMGAEMAVATFVWFAFVAYVVSHRLIRRHFEKIQHRAEQVMGGMLVLLGLKLATTSLKK